MPAAVAPDRQIAGMLLRPSVFVRLVMCAADGMTGTVQMHGKITGEREDGREGLFAPDG